MNLTVVHFPGGWYADATRHDHVVLYPDSRIGTSRGDVALPAGGNVLYLRCAEKDDALLIAGQGHDDGRAWLWNGSAWHAVTPVDGAYGTSPCCFGPLGLYVSTPAVEHNILVIDVETGEQILTLTKAVGARGIAAVTGLGMNPSDVHAVDEWYGHGGLAEYTDLGTGLLVGQGAISGLCARDGQTFTELEPGSVKFVRATLDGTVITSAAWKDAEGGAVVVRVDRSELHPPVSTRPDKYWLAPNIASRDLIALINEPHAFAQVGVCQLYVQNVLFDGANQGPNTAAALIAADVYRTLAAMGVPLGIEMGSVKGGDCQCVNALTNVEQAVSLVRAHGGDVAAVSQDEPLTAWINDCKSRTINEIADSVAAWMKRATELGIPHVGWIEAWPHVGFAVQQQFLDLLGARGVVPSHWHLDIDWHTAESQKKDPAAFIRAASALATSRGITLGLICNSTVDPIATDGSHYQNLQALAERLHSIKADAPRIVVQSWAFRTSGGLQDVPNNLGVNGLVASLTDVVTRFGAVPMPPIPEPPPVEIANMSAYGPPAIGYQSGTTEPHPDGDLAVRKSNGYILCLTPDGTFEQRPNDGTPVDKYRPGPWERFKRSKKGNLIAERDGKTYVVPFEE